MDKQAQERDTIRNLQSDLRLISMQGASPQHSLAASVLLHWVSELKERLQSIRA